MLSISPIATIGFAVNPEATVLVPAPVAVSPQVVDATA